MIGGVSRTRTLLAVTVTVLAAPALGGCFGDDPGPAPPPSPSVSSSEVATPSATEKPGPTEPTMPPDGGLRTNAGAEAFVRYWIELVNYAQLSGDTRRLDSVTHSQCVGCNGLISTIRNAYASGGHIEGGTWHVGRLQALPLDFGSEWAAYAKAKSDSQRVVNAAGKVSTYEGGRFGLYVYVDWQDGWSMRWLRTPA